MKWKSLSRVRLCDTMDCIVHGILQARILECVTFPFSRRSSQPRDRTQVSHIASYLCISKHGNFKTLYHRFTMTFLKCFFQNWEDKFYWKLTEGIFFNLEWNKTIHKKHSKMPTLIKYTLLVIFILSNDNYLKVLILSEHTEIPLKFLRTQNML